MVSKNAMGFFNRRAAPVDANTTTATGAPVHTEKKGIFGRKHEAHMINGSPAWNTKPTFGQWIKATALDIVSMAVMGAIGLGVYMARPAPSRSFPGISCNFPTHNARIINTNAKQ